MQVIINTYGVKSKAFIPMEWNDVSYGLYKKMAKCKDADELFCTTLGIDKEVLKAENIIDLYALSSRSKVFNTKPSTKKGHEVITYKGKEIHLMKDCLNGSIVQYEDLKQVLSKGEDNEAGLIFGIYLQPLIDGKYDYARVEELQEFIDTLDVETVLNRYFFFVNKYHRKKNLFQTLYQYLKRMISMKKQGITI